MNEKINKHQNVKFDCAKHWVFSSIQFLLDLKETFNLEIFYRFLSNRKFIKHCKKIIINRSKLTTVGNVRLF